MSSSDEFLDIIKAAREQVAFLNELGVAHLDSELTPGHVQAAKPLNRVETPRVHIHSEPVISVAVPAAEIPRRAVPTTKQTKPAASLLFQDAAVGLPALEKSSETFEQIHAEIGDCTRCPLYEKRTHVVHTEGNQKARLMFVGEAPGADEDAQARPFVGRAGQLLTKIIEAIGFKREEVLIGNVNRCRPPGNRPPTELEASTCKPFLLREIAVVQPDVIVVLGNTATRNLLETKVGITRLRGEFQDYHGVKVMPTFHPAYLLRDPSKKQETWQDLKKVRDYLETLRKREN